MSQPEFIEVQQALAGISYPATKAELLHHAEEHGASDGVLKALASIPEEEYEGPGRVSSAVAGSS